MNVWLALLITMSGVAMGGVLTWIVGKIQQFRLLRELRDMALDRERVSLKEEFLMTEMLANKIKKDGYKPDAIFAVCPGGAMVAEWLSRRFLGSRSAPIPVSLIYMRREQGKKDVEIDVVSVDDDLTAIPSRPSKDSKVLLVNDISRGGHTLNVASRFLRENFPEGEIRSATLICNKVANFKPLYWTAMTNKLIRFDWKTYN